MKEFIFSKGWYEQESDGYYPFRWMKKEAICLLKNFSMPGRKYLQITAGHSFPEDRLPVLEVFANQKKIGERKIYGPFSSYFFPFEEEGDIQFELRLNQTFRASKDGRELGIMVRRMEILTPSEVDPFPEGWYPLEYSSPSLSYRWMKQEANCLFTNLPQTGKRYLRLEAGHPFPSEKNPVLEIFVNGEKKSEIEVIAGEKKYYVPLDFRSNSYWVELKLNKTFLPRQKGDRRKLGMVVKKIEVIAQDADGLLVVEGLHEWDKDEFIPFRWLSLKARIFLAAQILQKNKYLCLYISSEFVDYSQELELTLGGIFLAKVPLLYKWNYYSFSLQPFFESLKEKESNQQTDDAELVISVNKLFPPRYHPEDKRELGVRISRFEFSNDDEQHENLLFFHRNALMNFKEMTQGKTNLDSFPLNLGIDLYAKCNIKPHCVYCLWDKMKEMEGDQADVVVDDKTLEGYGPFFRSARTLVNCSFGEPLLHPRFQEILDLCAKNKKIVELSTNGQAFTSRTIQALVGKPIYLYISLDAATKETYAKIRNDRWDSIIPNLVFLNEERKKRGGMPKIYMVFMPMRVNRNDLEEYFRLCQKIEADALVLRPLLYLWNPQIKEDRGGYHFDYEKEMLSGDEIEDICRDCEKYSKKYGVAVVNQFNFGIIKEPGAKDMMQARK